MVWSTGCGAGEWEELYYDIRWASAAMYEHEHIGATVHAAETKTRETFEASTKY